MIYRAPAWQTVALTAIVALAVSALLTFSRPAEVFVDGQKVETEVPPVTVSADKVFVPLRSIADALGARTELDEPTGRIYVIRANQSLRMKLGDRAATLNGMPMTLGHEPFRVRGHVMIGLSSIARVFSVRATYDPRSGRINVVTAQAH